MHAVTAPPLQLPLPLLNLFYTLSPPALRASCPGLGHYRPQRQFGLDSLQSSQWVGQPC